MKIIKYLVSAFLSGVLMFSCTDDEKEPGNPILELKSEFEAGFFGDSIPFTVGVSDQQSVPLSTVKLKLFFGEEMVSEKVIRTKTEGDYSGKLYVPFYANIPNGNAQLEIILQNVNMTMVKQTIDLPLSRPDYPYLMLVSGGNEIRMERVAANVYEASRIFRPKCRVTSKPLRMAPMGTKLPSVGKMAPSRNTLKTIFHFRISLAVMPSDSTHLIIQHLRLLWPMPSMGW